MRACINIISIVNHDTRSNYLRLQQDHKLQGHGTTRRATRTRLMRVPWIRAVVDPQSAGLELELPEFRCPCHRASYDLSGISTRGRISHRLINITPAIAIASLPPQHRVHPPAVVVAPAVDGGHDGQRVQLRDAGPQLAERRVLGIGQRKQGDPA